MMSERERERRKNISRGAGFNGCQQKSAKPEKKVSRYQHVGVLEAYGGDGGAEFAITYETEVASV